VADSEAAAAEAEWCANTVWGDSPPVVSIKSVPIDPVTPSTTGDSNAVDLDPPESPSRSGQTQVDANAGAKRVGVVLGVGLVGAISLIVGALMSSGASDDPPDRRSPAPVAVAAPAPPAAPEPTPAAQDQAVAFTASADCPAGSTSAQSLTDTTHDSAWVCVRGPAGAAVDGQVLHVDFGASHVLTAVSVTPGWVAKTTGGQDEWLQHRVVSRLQYCFNDDDHTIVTQVTGNAHGPVTLPLQHPVLASDVTVIVLQTTRPPASPLPSTEPHTGALPGLPDWVPDDGGGTTALNGTPEQVPTGDVDPTGDPVDATFAMSGLQFFGHPPK
jgi:hypothetical protein